MKKVNLRCRNRAVIITFKFNVIDVVRFLVEKTAGAKINVTANTLETEAMDFLD